jgi:DNA-binding transcriptional MerR regulator
LCVATIDRTNNTERNAIMWKVGALAKQTGLSIRMLRYYDEIGLLQPSARTPSGHRLYGPDDVTRLQRVLSLRQLGFALEEIGECLRRPEYTLERVVDLHLARVRERIKAQQRLERHLEAMTAHLRAAQTVSVDEFIRTIEAMTMSEKYLTLGQVQEIDGRREAMSEERRGQVLAEWPALIQQVREQMEAGGRPGQRAGGRPGAALEGPGVRDHGPGRAHAQGRAHHVRGRAQPAGADGAGPADVRVHRPRLGRRGRRLTAAPRGARRRGTRPRLCIQSRGFIIIECERAREPAQVCFLAAGQTSWSGSHQRMRSTPPSRMPMMRRRPVTRTE